MTAKKWNNTLGFLRCNLCINNEGIESLMRSSLEYCSTVWNPYTKDQTHKLEMIQRTHEGCQICDQPLIQHQQRILLAWPHGMGNSGIKKGHDPANHVLQDQQRPCGHPSQPVPHPSTGPYTILAFQEVLPAVYSHNALSFDLLL